MSVFRVISLTGVLATLALPLAAQVRFLTPRWSPDGQRIMFAANLDNPRRFDLYAIGREGGDPVRLVQDARDGSWSPDGTRLLYSVMREGNLDILVRDAGGGEARRLTDSPNLEYQPVWSRDGKRIAFVSIPPGAGARHDVHLMNADGSGKRALGETAADEQVVSWSGSHIAFGSNRDGNWEIYVTDADRGGIRRLTTDSSSDTGPAYSPDGRAIAYVSDRGGSRRMWRMNADGTQPAPLGNTAGGMLAWSPDGRQLAFVATVDGAAGVFSMNADGTGVRRVTAIPQAPAERLAPLGWLAGCWELRTPTRVTMEMWMPPAGNLMVGGARTVIEGVAREHELTRLMMRGDTLVYTAIPSGQKETDFKGRPPADTGFVVENPAHDFPRRIIYRKRGADSLLARIEGPGAGGATRGVDYAMKRVACER